MKPLFDEVTTKRIERCLSKNYTGKEAMIEAAGDFGRLIAHGEKSGLSIPLAFEAARNHFKFYGKVMIEFADLVTLEMMPKPKTAQTQQSIGSVEEKR
jgi:hypothetical protein